MFSTIISSPLVYMAFFAILVFIMMFFIKFVSQFEEHFDLKWALQLKDGRLLRVVNIRSRSQMEMAKLKQVLRWFGYRLVNNAELVSMLEETDCPEKVIGYNDKPSGGVYLETIVLPDKTKNVLFANLSPGVTKTTMIGVTRITHEPRMNSSPSPTAAR